MADVQVTIGSKNSPLETGLAKAKQSVDSFATSTSNSFKDVGKGFLAAFAVGSIIDSIKGIFDDMGHLQDLAETLDETAESLQRVGKVAKESGVDLDGIAKATNKVTLNAIEAIGGNRELSDSFKTLGIDATKFVDLPLEEKLLQLSKGYEDGGSSAEKLSAILKVLGKSGAELIPLLKAGPDALKESFASATVVGNAMVARIDAAGDKIEAFWGKFKAYGTIAVAEVINQVQNFFAMLDAVGSYVGTLAGGGSFEEANTALEASVKRRRDAIAEENKPKTKGKATDVESLLANGEKTAEKEKKDAEELYKVQSENVKKQVEANFRKLELLEKQKKLLGDIALLESAQKLPGLSKLDVAQNIGVILDTKKELESINSEIAKGEESRVKEQSKKMERLAKDQIKTVLDAKKDELKGAEDSIKSLTKNATPVDSLRAIGGGLGGVNYNTTITSNEVAQLALARENIVKLNRVIEELQKANNPIVGADGSFE